MLFTFSKYQATGNDFVLIDNRAGTLNLSVEQVRMLCDRHFGIGADGLILIEPHPTADFRLVYYNRDGSQSLCGNGSRAAVVFAGCLGLIRNGQTVFEAYDGLHEARIMPNGWVRLRMHDVADVRENTYGQFVNTGSPHVVQWVSGIATFSVAETGAKIRHAEAFAPGGTNVNFAEALAGGPILVRTFERGVEAETLSCGTGVTAVALAAARRGFTSPVHLRTPGGELQVEFKMSQTGTFSEIFLSGPAKMVFQGNLEL